MFHFKPSILRFEARMLPFLAFGIRFERSQEKTHAGHAIASAKPGSMETTFFAPHGVNLVAGGGRVLLVGRQQCARGSHTIIYQLRVIPIVNAGGQTSECESTGELTENHIRSHNVLRDE